MARRNDDSRVGPDPPMLQRMTAHPVAVDAVVAGFFAVASAVHVATESPGWGHPSARVALVLALGATVPFALRRHRPLGVLAVINRRGG